MRLTLAGALSQSLSTARESMWIVAPKKVGKNWVSEHLLVAQILPERQGARWACLWLTTAEY